MLDYFAGRRFNLIDMFYNSGCVALALAGHWWWVLAVLVGGVALSVALEVLNGEYE